jgi:hypothetical protein
MANYFIICIGPVGTVGNHIITSVKVADPTLEFEVLCLTCKSVVISFANLLSPFYL